MSKFYRLTADTDVAEYVRPAPTLYEEPCGEMTLAEAVRQGKAQFIDPAPLEVGVSDDGGLEFPDFLLYEGVPLFSAKFYDELRKLNVYLPFCKQVTLKDDLLGYVEKYILVVPPQVNALEEAGRYKLFVLPKTGTLVTTEEVKKAVVVLNLENVDFDEMEETSV